jgi:aminopeptidase N
MGNGGMMRRLLTLGMAVLVGRSLAVAAQLGVSRELARERASQLSDLRYALQFTLTPHADSTVGHEELRFQLKKAGFVMLDFREGEITNLTINSRPASARIENGHVQISGGVTGENHLSLDFTAPVATAGKAITRYEDKDDGSEYIYTLFVPMDASMAFPCFDQPDLKGRFTLEVTAPANWAVISNSPVETSENGRTTFGETRPISTYLFAFAAGPFQEMQHIFVRRSQAARARSEIPQVEDIAQRGMRFLADYFAQPFPFPKYDMVLIPGFAYGGMEHAGATFLREESVLFRTAPTETDRFNRNILVLHELTHQWFGDFTTMRWFDDLWLKEGFAEYMAFRTMAALAPEQHVWARFYQEIKPSAYGIDVTKGTTPIYQNIGNLTDAKSAYGAIVYDKAPGLLRQLAFLLRDTEFRNGLRIYLHEHPYGNAGWMDLVKAFERASGQDLTRWADAWIRRRGMPLIRTAWACDGQRLTEFTLTQKDALGEGGIWPLATEILLGYRDAAPVRLRVQITGETASVQEAIGKACPDYVFGNDDDYAYGLFLLDAHSREYILAHMGAVPDLFRRTLLWGALWDAVRFTELDPRQYLKAALLKMPEEADEQLVQSLARRSAVALHDYVSPHVRREFVSKFEGLAMDRMMHSPAPGLRIVYFRMLNEIASTNTGLGRLEDLLDGKVAIPGVTLRRLDRWRMIATLLAQSAPQAERIYAAEKADDQSGDGLKYSYVAAAARPNAETKKWYFHDYLDNPARPEDWVSQSLGPFNEWNESELTLPYLQPALAALPEIKRQRKIFFVLAWLNAFIGGQHSAEADVQVHDWLDKAQIDPDLRLKVLQVVDDLDRAVRIRERFG